MFEEIKEAIAFSQLGIIKVEPTLPNTKVCSCVCKCTSLNDEFLSEITSSRLNKSLVHLNLRDKTNTSMMTT
ncbi:unnamed protein product, partial [Adineta steineri]